MMDLHIKEHFKTYDRGVENTEAGAPSVVARGAWGVLTPGSSLRVECFISSRDGRVDRPVGVSAVAADTCEVDHDILKQRIKEQPTLTVGSG